jgi:tetratricopeptide (TPR) repeat protein
VALEKLILAVQIPFFYLYKIIIPCNLSVDYGSHLFGSTLTDLRVIGAAASLFVISALACRFRSSLSDLNLCLLWYLITLVPVLHLFQTNPIVADRYAYFASYPICLLISVYPGAWFSRYPAGRAVVAIIILVSALTAFTHNRIWQSEKSLWEYTISVSPRSAMAHSNLARLYFIDENNSDKGLNHAKSAQLLNPGDTNFDVFKGVLNLRSNQPQQALDDFNRALARDNQSIEALVNMSLAYQLLETPGEACRCLRQAVGSSALDMPGNLRETAREMLRDLEGKHPSECIPSK